MPDLKNLGASLRSTFVERSRTRQFCWSSWKALGEAGFFRSAAPAVHGGSSLALSAIGQALSELTCASGDAGFAFPLVPQLMAIRLLGLFGSPALVKRYLDGLLAASTSSAIANHEHFPDSDFRKMQSCITVDAAGRKCLTLKKTPITNVPQADVLFTSVYEKTAPFSPAAIQVHALDRTLVQQRPLSLHYLATGRTGVVQAQEVCLAPDESRLSSATVSGGSILQDSFDCNRFLTLHLF